MTWQPIETAPTDGTEIDVWSVVNSGQPVADGKRVPDVHWDTTGSLGGFVAWDCYADWFIAVPYPTHWMPRPEAPLS